MSSGTIRLAKVADLQAVIDVERRADARFAAHGLAAVLEAPQAGVGDRLPGQTDGRLFVAEDESGCVVGFAQVDLVDDEPHIEQVSIDSDAAGHRIGAHLMGTCEEWARAHGHNRITLCTYRDVPWNGPYYEELGWVALAEDKCGPQLQGLRIRERELGLEIQPRQTMVNGVYRHALVAEGERWGITNAAALVEAMLTALAAAVDSEVPLLGAHPDLVDDIGDFIEQLRRG